MELRHLRYFVAVAEELNFGRAAARLSMSQPPLSQQIADLERELGVRLFWRNSRRVELTDAGAAFLEGARRTLAQAADAARAAQLAGRGARGSLRLAYLASNIYDVLPTLLRSFAASYPEIEVDVYERTTTEAIKELEAGEIQVALLRPPVHSSHLEMKVFRRDPIVAVLPCGHRLASVRSLRPADLRGERFILFPRATSPHFYDYTVDICVRAGFSPHIDHEVIGAHGIIGLVGAGRGISLVPATLHDWSSSGVVFKTLVGEREVAELAIAWRRNEQSRVVHSFVDYVLATAGADSGVLRSGGRRE